ncbi:MAG: DUF350 domain-containing protein [Rhodobacteraceae bacterium]|nr:DUF350 domain-containing protein [Paracoccaceae bacterium]MAY46628.1 DUF350 domain-containing protein [Paracoccaceae bacterium]QEW21881.1 putative membrane protein [Marinibacterium anthonyi]|tara:strand:+ start:35 stop:250 length:216 start_codon:yes stop_codon:yes gene_type:complete
MGTIQIAEIISTIFYTFLGLGLLVICWLVIEAITPLSLRKELEEDQNTAIAIVIGALFLSVSIIIAAVILS